MQSDPSHTYLDGVWFPRFLANWEADGELIEILTGQSEYTLEDWMQFADYAYEQKERELCLEPR